ncbi:MAG: potassium channel family protein [Clostridioides difficile]|nr:potassium channel family protein [Clostridioides difficile]
MKCAWESKIYKNKKCNHHATDGDYCIFHKGHKSNEEKRIMISKIINEEISDFSGFIFEDDFYSNTVIDYDYNMLDFSECVFNKKADFSDFKFRKSVKFNHSIFKEQVYFKRAVFIGNCILNKTTFNKKYIDNKIFKGVRFQGQDLIIKNAKYFPRMDGILFNDYSKIIFDNIEYEKEDYRHGKLNYRIARNQALKIGDYERIGHYYYNERYYSSKLMKSSDYAKYSEYLGEKFFDSIAKHTIGYGEKPWNILIVIVIIISLFAFFYLFLGVENLEHQLISLDITKLDSYSLKEIVNKYIDLWYFSMVTFTTLGYGDLIVISGIGKFVASLEVLLGISCGAIWTSLIIKRMLR